MPSFFQTQGRVLWQFQRRIFASRFFTVSLLLHAILVVSFGGTQLFRHYVEPPDFSAEAGAGFITPTDAPQAPPTQTPASAQQKPAFNVAAAAGQAVSAPIMSAITTNPPVAQTAFTIPAMVTPTIARTINPATPAATPPPSATFSGGISREIAQGIASFTKDWSKAGGGAGGVGTGTAGAPMKNREFQFTAYLAKYRGGDWDATAHVDKKTNQIVGGSVPNLLYFMNKFSRDRIHAEPQAVPLDLSSDEMFVKKPPFIFFCGHRDFTLTDKEVENLRKYIQLGGCVWGDSSLPGLRSRFDIAFRREMRRVIPDQDKQWETLPTAHDIFSRNPAKVYFTDLTGVPAGLNFYQEPVYALKIYDEIAVIYTANDYGDMWQFGLNERGEIDMRRDERGNFVAINNTMWERRDLYFRNINPASLMATYKFGTNIVLHLLTRWEDKLRNVPHGL